MSLTARPKQVAVMHIIKKKRPNRRRRAPLKNRMVKRLKGLFKLTLVIVAIPLVAYAGWRFYDFLYTTPLLGIDDIVVLGNERVSKEDIINMAGISRGENLFVVDTKDIIARVMKEPWIDGTEVRKRIPNTIIIEVSERRPLAIVNAGGLHLMDRKGVVFKSISPRDDIDLPIISGFSREELDYGISSIPMYKTITLLRELEGRKGFGLEDVSEIYIGKDGDFTIYTLKGAVRVDLGKNGFKDKLSKLDKILYSMGGELGGVEEVDLDNTRGVVVRFSSDSGIHI